MNDNTVLADILRQNENAQRLSELIPVIIKVIAAYHANEIDLPSADVRRKDLLMWSPSVARKGSKRPRLDCKAFTEAQIARLLNRLQNSGNRFKADRNIAAAFALLRAFENGGLNPSTFEVLAKNLSGRAQLALARIVSKKTS